ncbi:2317_t:CDS:2, partial [Gigaspora margarita]
AKAGQIRRNLSFYGKVIVKEFLVSKRSKAIFKRAWPKNDRREEFVENSWRIYYKNGKMVLMPEQFISHQIEIGINEAQTVFTL